VPSSPTVTIVIPTHDRVDLLRHAIDSVLAQEYEALTLLVIDDGSTDATPELLDRYAREHPRRVRTARHDNVGQARSLNRGFEMVETELVGYLSSDDTLRPGAVGELAQVLAADPGAVLAYPGYHVIDEQGEVVDTIEPPQWSRAEAVRLQDTIVGPGALMRRAALVEAGPWRPDLRYLGDFELWLRLSERGRFRRVERPLACWRRHPGALTISDRGLEMARERVRLVEELYARDPSPELEAVRAQAHRNAYVLAAIVVAPGVNAAGERYYISDSHARAISSSAGSADAEAKLAEMRERVAGQREQIDELRTAVGDLQAKLAQYERFERLAGRITPSAVRPMARRLLRRGHGKPA
jgi:glycosyltransferase involved in cell wall biosynthesis/uncharacterized coiled-coil protein SlyX